MPSIVSTINLQLQSLKTPRVFLADITFLPNGKKKPIVVFAHGFKGFKDWGPFNAMARYFAVHGFFFIKFNFSHNGTTPEHPLEFADLAAFGNDNHSIQLDDLAAMLNWITMEKNALVETEANSQQIYLIGHSRGGSLVLLKAAEDPRIKKTVTWAAVSDLLAAYTPQDLADWKSKGVKWIANARTGQQMPVYYQYYEDLIANAQRLNVLKAAALLNRPLLIVHGENDGVVSLSNAQAIHSQAPHSLLVIIKNANHTFGGVHPFTYESLPVTLQQLYDTTIQFLNT